jgi:DNA-binding CsgD family transcriptional regulator/pimeloyl-ACP methyl ester carboxylesterase
MDAPPVQYARTSDGYDIAYCVSGSGTPLVVAGTGLAHLQLAWQMPGLRDWLAAFGARFRLVQIDLRGTGMSSRDLPGLEVDDYQRDIEAVVENLGLERFILYAHSFLPSCVACHYAVRNPARVSAVILAATLTALSSQRAPALFAAFPGQDWNIFLRTLVQLGHNPGGPADAETILDLYRQAYDQRNFLLMVDAANRFSLVDLLPCLETPALVLSARAAGLWPQEESLKVARLARAKIVSLDGESSYGDPEQGIRAVEAFLADLSLTPPSKTAGETRSLVDSLSPRELDVLRLIAAGRSNAQIAEELVISLSTVAKHVTSILAKTGAANRTEAALYARDRGLA